MRAALSLIIFCSFTTNAVRAQSPGVIEHNLLRSFKRIVFFGSQKFEKDGYEDSLKTANDSFVAELKTYTERYSSTIKYPFRLLKREGLDIFTSNDGLLRIYSWNTQMGGQIIRFRNLAQYKTMRGVKSKLFSNGDDFEVYYSNLHTFKTGNKTYYLCVWGSIYSTRDGGKGISVFTVEHGKLNSKVKLFKTQSGLQSSISFEYDDGAVYDPKEISSEIRFDAANQVIKIPLITEKGRVTRKFITYKFTGKYFETVKS